MVIMICNYSIGSVFCRLRVERGLQARVVALLVKSRKWLKTTDNLFVFRALQAILTIVLINPGLKVRSCGRREHPLPWLRLRRCLVLPSAYEDSNRIVLVQ